MIATEGRVVYFAGDTAFGDHFSQVRGMFGSPCLSLIPIGAYKPRWFMSPIHMDPEQALRAHEILGSETSVAIHHGTFQLADDSLDAAPEELARSGKPDSFLILKNGESVDVLSMIDKHALAVVSIVGSSFDLLGALYLAYDLLGGEHGPLRTVTRGVTYGVLYGAGYGLALGPVFGLTSGAAHGISLAWEFSRAARGKREQGIWRDIAMSAMRGFGYALGTTFLYGSAFGITFGALSTVGQVVAYRAGMRPTIDYAPATGRRSRNSNFLAD